MLGTGNNWVRCVLASQTRPPFLPFPSLPALWRRKKWVPARALWAAVPRACLPGAGLVLVLVGTVSRRYCRSSLYLPSTCLPAPPWPSFLGAGESDQDSNRARTSKLPRSTCLWPLTSPQACGPAAIIAWYCTGTSRTQPAAPRYSTRALYRDTCCAIRTVYLDPMPFWGAPTELRLGLASPSAFDQSDHPPSTIDHPPCLLSLSTLSLSPTLSLPTLSSSPCPAGGPCPVNDGAQSSGFSG